MEQRSDNAAVEFLSGHDTMKLTLSLRSSPSGSVFAWFRRAGCTLGLAGICSGLMAAPLGIAAPWAPWSPSLSVPSVSECNSTTPQTLQASALNSATHPARAAWLDARTLRWADAPLSGTYRLHASSVGSLRLSPDMQIQGAESSWTLQIVPAEPQTPSTLRFSHIAPGATLRLSEADARQLPALLRQQVLLTREEASGRVLEATHVQIAGALDALYDRAAQVQDLGSSLQERTTTFKVWAPTAQQVQLCLFGADDHGVGSAVDLVALHRDEVTGVWAAKLPQRLNGVHYAFLVDVHVRGVGRVRQLASDPYALALNADSARARVVDLNDAALKPPGWATTPRPKTVRSATDLVVYELHVRDFSVGDASVPPAHRGKYLAFTQSTSSGMQHLKRLARAGLTDVHLLPVFDLATVPEVDCVTPDIASLKSAPDSPEPQALMAQTQARDCFNWGYDPWHYTVPEGSYASDARDARVRIVEFRRMVQALHRTGLRVGMDVVYNHTTASGQHPKSVLDRIVPGYYHRLNALGEVERSTCCDNTATEHLMMGKLMMDSVVVWARDYGIDSFRFDLMGHQPRAVMEQLQQTVNAATGRHIHLLGEGWNFGEVENGKRFVQAAQGALNGSGIGSFNDRARDTLRGGGCCDAASDAPKRQGWVNGLYYAPNETVQAGSSAPRHEDLLQAADLVRVVMGGSLRDLRVPSWRGPVVNASEVNYAGQGAGFASQPSEVVNYAENHDNETLFDAHVLKLPGSTSREDRARVQHLASAVVALSQGVAYFHAGQEILRSKSLDRNSYDSGDWFNRLDWTLTDNGFGAGLPPKAENGAHWSVLGPRLADPRIKPSSADITWTRDAFLDLLKIRASTTMLRLPTAQDVKQRLRFFNTGVNQEPTVVAVDIDGAGLAGARYRRLVALINVDLVAHQVSDESLRGQPLRLHPVLASAQAADRRARLARFDGQSGSFTVPARTAVVFVAP